MLASEQGGGGEEPPAQARLGKQSVRIQLLFCFGSV